MMKLKGEINMKRYRKQPLCTLAVTAAICCGMAIPSYASVPALTVGPDVKTIETVDENGRRVITWIFPPTPVEWPSEADTWERIPPLTEAPEVGETLGNILKEGTDINDINADNYTKCYRTGSIGQCTWYAQGRFKEIFGIDMHFGLGNAKNWINNAYKSEEIKTITDINDIREQSIAVLAPTEDENQPGHVLFIEYVERDAQGNPITIYYTEANGLFDLQKGEFDYGYDGTVRKQSFEKFKSPYQLQLIGYIIPAK